MLTTSSLLVISETVLIRETDITKEASTYGTNDSHGATTRGSTHQQKTTLDRYRPLSRSTTQRLHDDLRLLLTYNSNAIEGNTLSLRETQIVLEEGVTIDGHPLREYLEATNHAHAFDALSSLITQPITIEAILHLHHLVTLRRG
jgi:Fic family protein